MEQARKERIVGAGILLGFAIIFLPMLLDGSGQRERLRLAASEKDPPRLDELSFSDESPDHRVAEAPPALPAGTAQLPEATAPEDLAADPLLMPGQLLESLEQQEPDLEQQEPDMAGRADEPSSSTPAVVRAPEVEENAPDRVWVVQVGSFTERDNANALSTRLQDAGYQAFVQDITQGGDARVFRVHVGPRQSRHAARQLLDTLQRREHLRGMLFKAL